MSESRDHGRIRLEQTISSRMDEAEMLCLKIREVLEPDGLPQLCFRVELLAREILANALNHGNGNDPEKSVVLQLRISRTWIRLRVTDEGPGFAWRNALKKTPGTNETSGRGMRIYVLYAARTQFNRRGNQITIWIDRKSEQGMEIK